MISQSIGSFDSLDKVDTSRRPFILKVHVHEVSAKTRYDSERRLAAPVKQLEEGLYVSFHVILEERIERSPTSSAALLSSYRSSAYISSGSPSGCAAAEIARVYGQTVAVSVHSGAE